MDDNRTIFGNNLQKLRKQKTNMNQEDMGRVIGLGKSAYSNIECGNTNKIDIDNMMYFSNVYNVTLDDLFRKEIDDDDFKELTRDELIELSKELYPSYVNRKFLSNKKIKQLGKYFDYIFNNIIGGGLDLEKTSEEYYKAIDILYDLVISEETSKDAATYSLFLTTITFYYLIIDKGLTKLIHLKSYDMRNLYDYYSNCYSHAAWKDEFIDCVFGYLCECIKILKNDNTTNELGDYYIYVLFGLGLVPNEESIAVNSKIANNLFYFLYLINNKYVVKLVDKMSNLTN